MVGNPVMFVTRPARPSRPCCYLPAARTHSAFLLQITLWLWFTVLFATSRRPWLKDAARPQADTLRKAAPKRWPAAFRQGRACAGGVQCFAPRRLVVVKSWGIIPGDGEIHRGRATVDESAITGESAPIGPRKWRRPQRRDGGTASFPT